MINLKKIDSNSKEGFQDTLSLGKSRDATPARKHKPEIKQWDKLPEINGQKPDPKVQTIPENASAEDSVRETKLASRLAHEAS